MRGLRRLQLTTSAFLGVINLKRDRVLEELHIGEDGDPLLVQCEEHRGIAIALYLVDFQSPAEAFFIHSVGRKPEKRISPDALLGPSRGISGTQEEDKVGLLTVLLWIERKSAATSHSP